MFVLMNLPIREKIIKTFTRYQKGEITGVDELIYEECAGAFKDCYDSVNPVTLQKGKLRLNQMKIDIIIKNEKMDR